MRMENQGFRYYIVDIKTGQIFIEGITLDEIKEEREDISESEGIPFEDLVAWPEKLEEQE